MIKILLLLFALNYTTNASAAEEYLSTGLPVCYIETGGVKISKNIYINAHLKIEGGGEDYEGNILISGRGNKNWTLPKKPYNIKFNKKTSVFGLAKAKKFALMSNVCDRTLCRTALGHKLGELVGYEWPLHGRYVELVLDGEHKGCFFFSETVGASENRVSIDKKTGFILEYKYEFQARDTIPHFTTARNRWLMEFKDPDNDEITDEQRMFGETSFNALEESVFASDFLTNRRWADMIDMESFVKWYYWKNIMQMEECNRYYVMENNQEGTRFKMGPLWDFDWTIGMAYSKRVLDVMCFRNKLLYYCIAQDPVFMGEVAKYHFANRRRIEKDLFYYYDSIVKEISRSEAIDAAIWGTFDGLSTDWEQELSIDMDYLRRTFRWLDASLKPYLPSGMEGDVNGDGILDLADVNGITNLILEENSYGLNPNVADVNNDGKVSILDVVTLLGMITKR